jgi:hypothetical protein
VYMVGIPEASIRIYMKVNQCSYQLAETLLEKRAVWENDEVYKELIAVLEFMED